MKIKNTLSQESLTLANIKIKINENYLHANIQMIVTLKFKKKKALKIWTLVNKEMLFKTNHLA